MMDIISRNFFRLLRAGVFGEEEQIEPMSAWKWRRVYHFSLMHGVVALLYDGIEKCSSQFFLQLPGDLLDAWKKSAHEMETAYSRQQAVLVELYAMLNRMQCRPILTNGQRIAELYDLPVHSYAPTIDIFFPFQTQGKKADKWADENGTNVNDTKSYVLEYEWKDFKVNHFQRLCRLTNKLLNHSLQNIVEREFRENEASYLMIGGTKMETTSNTLELLTILLRISHQMLNDGIKLKQFVDLGILLRKVGDRVDFVRLQGGIDKLGLKRIAKETGRMLKQINNFKEDDIPLLQSDAKTDVQRIFDELFNQEFARQADWYFLQGKDIFVHTSNSSAMMMHVRRSARYSRYYPSEGFTNFFASFIHSLSHIEE